MYVDGHIGLQIETNATSKLDDFDWSLSVVPNLAQGCNTAARANATSWSRTATNSFEPRSWGLGTPLDLSSSSCTVATDRSRRKRLRPVVWPHRSGRTEVGPSGHQWTWTRKFSSDVQLATRWPCHLRNGHLIWEPTVSSGERVAVLSARMSRIGQEPASRLATSAAAISLVVQAVSRSPRSLQASLFSNLLVAGSDLSTGRHWPKWCSSQAARCGA